MNGFSNLFKEQKSILTSEFVNWKAVKEFLKPDWRKVIIFIFVWHPLYFLLNFGILPFSREFPLIDKLLLLPLFPFRFVGAEWPPPNLVIILLTLASILLPAYWYVLSSTIVCIYDKIRKMFKF